MSLVTSLVLLDIAANSGAGKYFSSSIVAAGSTYPPVAGLVCDHGCLGALSKADS
jgi:hypothetical protein